MQQTERKPLFNLGQLVATPGALASREWDLLLTYRDAEQRDALIQ